MKLLYRYEIDYKTVDNDTSIVLKTYPVLRETEYSYWICPPIIGYQNEYNTIRKRISKTAINTFAFDTKEKAKSHFIRRTSRRIDWYDYWKEECEKGLKIIEQL